MSLGILLCMQIVKENIENDKQKYLKSFLIGLIVVFCYQGALSIFPMIVLTYKLLLEKNNLKENVKEVVKISFIYIILMLISVLYSEILFKDTRLQVNVKSIDLHNIIFWLKQLLVYSLGIIPPYVHIVTIISTFILIIAIYKAKLKYKINLGLKYIFIIIYGIIISLAPIIVGTGLELGPRMCLSYSSTIGLSLLIILYFAYLNKSRYQQLFIATLTIIIVISNFILYIVLTNQHLEVNKRDKENCLAIEKVIEDYETKNNIKVTKIAAIIDTTTSGYYPNFIHAGVITRKGLNSWATREIIMYYTNRNLQFEKFPLDKYEKYFKNLSSNDFSIEQVAIEGDTLYFLGR